MDDANLGGGGGGGAGQTLLHSQKSENELQ